jgi:hypothetical protein
MEPLDPELRAALKEAHPGLTDEDIDRSEALLDERMNTDPSEDPGRLDELDRARNELIRRAMPRYTEVVRVFNARRVRPVPEDDGDRTQVTMKRPRNEGGA